MNLYDKIKSISFRVKIIVTLSIVIIVTTYLSINMYSNYLGHRLFNNVEGTINARISLLKEQILFNVSQNGKKNIYPFLDNIRNMNDVKKAILIDFNGTISHPKEKRGNPIDTNLREQLSALDEPVTIKRFHEKGQHYARAFIDIKNSPNCYQCHVKSNKSLGYIVIDFSMQKYDDNMAATRNFGRIFTFLLLFIVLFSAIFVHLKFVRRSLSRFMKSIKIIEKGNLNERVKIPDTDELGQLAKSFNMMVEKLQKTQNELAIYHQKELNQVQKLATVGEMAASFAHELKNPLTGICNAIEIIINESNGSDKTQVLEEIQRQANRVTNAINDLLDFSQIDDPYLESGNINEIILSFFSAVENLFEKENVNLRLDLDKNVPKFFLDSALMEKVVFNIGINALQSTPVGGFVTIQTHYDESKNKVRLKIKDTGNGIPEENFEKIFTPFFTTRHQGTGLGLSITKEIIDKHGGIIFVDSIFGKGTTFTIDLPIHLDNGLLLNNHISNNTNDLNNELKTDTNQKSI